MRNGNREIVRLESELQTLRARIVELERGRGVDPNGSEVAQPGALPSLSNQQLHAILNAIPDQMLLIHKNGMLLASRCQDRGGWTMFPPGTPVDGIQQMLPGDFAATLLAHVQDCLRTGELQVFELRLATSEHDADLRYLEFRLVVSGSQEVLAIMRDVTAHKQAEEELRRSNAALENAQRIARIGNWDWEIATNRAQRSAEMYRIFGMEPQEFGATFEDFLNAVHPDDRDLVRRAAEEALRGTGRYRIDFHIVWPDGDVRTVHEDAEVVYSAEGRPVRVCGTTQDITDRVCIEAALTRKAFEAQALHRASMMAAETESFEVALQQCVDLVCELTHWPVGHAYLAAEDGSADLVPTTVWYLDTAAEYADFREMTEKTRLRAGICLPGRILNSGMPEWVEDIQQDSTFLRGQMCANVSVKGAFGFPIKIHTKTVAVLEFFSPYKMSPNAELLQVMGSLGEQVGRVWERKKAEEQLRQHQEEMAHFGRVSIMGEMASQLAHELNQPLSAIGLYAESALRMLSGDPAQQHETAAIVQKVAAQAHRAGQIIHRLRSYVRRHAPKRSTVDLNRLIREVSDFVGPEVRHRGISIRLLLGESIALVLVDTIQIEQVLVNLIRNGIDVMHDVARNCRELVIETSMHDESMVEVRVRDRGHGISRKVSDQLFEAYFTTKQGGMGMGLKISRSIVESHGGRLWATANTGEGTTFHFTLPKTGNA